MTIHRKNSNSKNGAPRWLQQAFQAESKNIVRYKPITTLKPLSPEKATKRWRELGLTSPLGEVASEITGSAYPYKHQQKTIEKVLTASEAKRKPIILRGGTGSGKSLAFLLPALSLILMGVLDFVIVFYPMKQLIEDQFYNLKKLLTKIYERTGKPVTAKIYHGERGLGTEEKIAWEKEIQETERNPPNILLATFDKTWYQLLHSTEKDCKLLKKIKKAKYLVFDEIHALKGLPAAYIRYFLQVHRKRNPDCQIILSTATIAKIDQFREQFLPSDFRGHNKALPKAEIIESNPLRGTIDVRAVPSESFLPLLKMVKRELEDGKIALVFVDSKKKIEEYAKKLGLTLKKDQAIYDSGSIGVLHANLHQKIRKKALQDARKGKVKIILTSAVMELGVDLNNIQTIINVGWPVSGKDGLLQRIARDRSKPGEHKVVYIVFDLKNYRDQLYYANLHLIREILEEYQCTPMLFPERNQKVISSIIILLLVYGYNDYEEIISFFPREQRSVVKRCLTILLCHAIIQKSERKLVLVEPNSSAFKKLISSSIRAISDNWTIVYNENENRTVLGFYSLNEILRGGMPGNIILSNKVPFQVRSFNKEEREIEVGLVAIPSNVTAMPSNIIDSPKIRMELFPKNRRLQSGLVFHLGGIIISKSPRSIAKYDPKRKENFRYQQIKEPEKSSFTVEEKSVGILVSITKIFNDPLLSLFAEKTRELLACLAIVLKTQIEVSLQIPQSEISVAYNDSQFAVYDRGGANGNAEYLFNYLPTVVKETITRLGSCSCLDGCEKCFGRDFSKLLPKRKSKIILKSLLEWMNE